MKFSKIACILLVFWIVGLIMEGCGCPDPSYFTCSVSSLTLEPRVDGTVTDENSPVPRNHYGILIFFELETQIAEFRKSASLIQSAHAMEQCRDDYSLKDSITSIRFFTDQDFDAEHPSGTDISDHFMALKWTKTNTSLTGAYIAVPLVDVLEDCVLNVSGDIEPLTCILATPPGAGTYTFRVVVGLSDGRVLEQSINAILE